MSLTYRYHHYCDFGSNSRAQGWEDIMDWNKKKEWLSTFLELPFGIPAQIRLEEYRENQPKEFEQCFRQWVQSLVEKV